MPYISAYQYGSHQPCVATYMTINENENFSSSVARVTFPVLSSCLAGGHHVGQQRYKTFLSWQEVLLERAATADAACRRDAWSCHRPHEEASIGTKLVLRESRNWSPPHRADCYHKAGVFLWDATDTPILKAGVTQVFCCLQPETT